MPDQLGITIEFVGKTLKFDKSVSNIEKSINILKKDMKYLNSELQLDPKNIRLISEKFKNLKVQERLAREELDIFLNDLKKLNDDKVSPFDERFKSTQRDIDKTEKKLAGIRKQIKQITDSFAETNEESRSFSDVMESVSDKTAQAASAFKRFSEAAGNYLKSATEDAIEFQDAFADVLKTVTVQEGQEYLYDEIRDGLRELATTVPTTASELAKIAGLAGQMNVPAEQIVDFTKAMVDFGNSTNITAEEATQDIAQIYNVIGKGGDYSNLNNLLSTIVELGNNSATTEKDIVAMFKNISAAASRVGMNETQMIALASTLASLGLDKGGASAISNIMTQIDMAVSTNSKKLKDWADAAGVSVAEFKKLWGEDASNALLVLLDNLKKTSDAGGNINEVFADLNVKELRRIDTLGRLINGSELYADALVMANKSYEEGTALTEEANKRYATMASKIQILKNTFTEFSLSLGDIILPIVEKFVDFLQKMVEWMNSWDETTKKIVVVLLTLVAAVTPVLLIISKLTGGLGWIVPKLKIVVTVLKGLMGIISGVGTKLLALLSAHPLVALVLALGAAFVTLYHNSEPFRKAVNDLIIKVKKMWEAFKQSDFVEKLGVKFQWLAKVVHDVFEVIVMVGDAIGWLVGKVGKFLGISTDIASNAASFSQRGRGQFQSGGFMSGGMTVTNTFTINGIEQLSNKRLIEVADLITDRVNENLGRMYA